MKSEAIKIAVVIPVYNGEKTIQKSIISLLNQTFKDWVAIIVNDGSIDSTYKIISTFIDDSRFIIINLEKNKGRGYARKIALAKVKEIGVKYMCMLDADDFYYHNKLEWQHSYMEKNPEITLTSCSIGYVSGNDELFGVLEIFDKPQTFYYSRYQDVIKVPHACSIIRVQDIQENTFDENMIYGQDQDFMIRLLINKKYAYIPLIGYLYNRSDSFSFKKYKKTFELEYYSKKKLGLPKVYLIKFLLIGKLKTLIISTLSLFNKQDFYLKKVTRKPSGEELKHHLKELGMLQTSIYG